MYRKGLSNRANKISSLVASIDNPSVGFGGQDLVPTAGVHGNRKNVFRTMPRFPPSKNKSSFSKMKITKSTQAQSQPEPEPAPEPAPASFPLTLNFNSAGEPTFTPTSTTHIIVDPSTYIYQIVGMGVPLNPGSLFSPSLKSTTGEFGIPITLPDTLTYDNVDVRISWDELKVLSTYVGDQLASPPTDKPKIKIFLLINEVPQGGGRAFYFNLNHYHTTSDITVTGKTFTKDSLALIFYNEPMDTTIADSMTQPGYWDPEPLQISLKNLTVTITEN